MTLRMIGQVRQGGRVLLAIDTGAPYAGLEWRISAGTGSLSAAASRADAGGVGTAWLTDAPSAGTAVAVEVDVYA